MHFLSTYRFLALLLIAVFALSACAGNGANNNNQATPLPEAEVIETSAAGAADPEQALFDWLLEHDPHFANFTRLPADIRARERYFFGNTRRGMQEYVDRLPDAQRQALLRQGLPA